MRSLAAKVTVVALVQLALVGVAVAPRLSARLTGDEYLLRVAPVDPIDPSPRSACIDAASSCGRKRLSIPQRIGQSRSSQARYGVPDGRSRVYALATQTSPSLTSVT